MAADHRRTTTGPLVNHRSTVADRQSTGGSWAGSGPPRGIYVDADVEIEGMKPSCRIELGTFDIEANAL
ncbi:hypothetical protein Tco_0574840, partial [Tanacetum coccineum]